MKFFYISTEPNKEGEFEIHERDCMDIPDMMIRNYLGPFNNGEEAHRVAKSKNPDAAICDKCCSIQRKTIVWSNKDSSSSLF